MDTHRLKNRIAELEAERGRLRAALEMFCGNIGTQEASSFNKARFPVTWAEGNAALTSTGEHEHPDTVLLNKLERQKLAGESWTLLERAGGGIPYPVADEWHFKAIRYQTAHEAIAALPGEEAERG